MDDDSVDPVLLRLLRRDGHDVRIPADVGLAGSSDQAHLAHAIRDQRAVLTRNHGDFEDLDDLVVSAAAGHHAGILVVRYDKDPRNNIPQETSPARPEIWKRRELPSRTPITS